jgi:hypothetical protein
MKVEVIMKNSKTYFIIPAILVVLALPLLMGMYLETRHSKWEAVDGRQAVAVADATLGVTARKWADRPSATLCKTEEAENFPTLRFRFSTAGASCDYEIWQYAENDDAEFVVTGSAYAGTQTATMGGYYAHKITISAWRWFDAWRSTDTSGNNEMCKLWGDGKSGYYWYIRIYNISAGTVSVDKRSF